MTAQQAGRQQTIWLELAQLELRSLWRRRLGWVAALALLGMGSAAIAHGAARVARERAAIAIGAAELEGQARYLTEITRADDDLGLLLYYLAMPVSQEPSAWAPIATGLRGVHPASRQLRFLGLVPQLYQTEIGNPMVEHAGHFDLAVVLVFLLPLLIIALGHDVCSRDDDLGTAVGVRAQPVRLSRLVAGRLALRAGWLSAALLALLALAVTALGLPLDARVALFAAATLSYAAIWSLAVFFVASWRRSSVFNALALLGSWLGACVLLPALLHLVSNVAWPVRGGVELTLEQRMDMNSRWDRPKSETLDPFYRRRPEWAGTAVPSDRFSWPWYYAMHEMGDVHVGEQVTEHRAALERRARWTARAAWLLPPLALELLLERLAGNDLTTTLAYRDSIARYHEALRQTVYPWIFRYQGLSAFQLDRLPRHHFSSEQLEAPLPGWAALLALLLLALAGVPGAARRLDDVERSDSAEASADDVHASVVNARSDALGG
jgi:ABC-2 type transport system permease protein